MKTDDQVADASIGAETVTACTHDPAEFELALRPWELLCAPQSAGEFRHHITAIRSPRFVLYRERYELPIKLQGLTPDRMLGICIPLRLGPVVWGHEYTGAAIPATLPGPVDATLGSGYGQLIALVAVDHLRQAIPEGDYERLESAARSRVFQLSPQLIRAFSRWSNRYLNIAEVFPDRFEDSARIQKIFHELIDFLLHVSANLPPPRPISNLASRQRGLLRAIDFLRNRLDTQIPLAELCQVAKISERSLQYAFRQEYGMSPSEFMRKRRLHAVRQQLTLPDSEHTTVSAVAIKYGFSELGRFAAEYRRLFGVRPSDSLRQRR